MIFNDKYRRPWSDAAHFLRHLIRAYDIMSLLKADFCRWQLIYWNLILAHVADCVGVVKHFYDQCSNVVMDCNNIELFLSIFRITHCSLSFQSKWLYVGTERGNVHIVNIESFVLSGYVINWNKAIELWVEITAHSILTYPLNAG